MGRWPIPSKIVSQACYWSSRWGLQNLIVGDMRNCSCRDSHNFFQFAPQLVQCRHSQHHLDQILNKTTSGLVNMYVHKRIMKSLWPTWIAIWRRTSQLHHKDMKNACWHAFAIQLFSAAQITRGIGELPNGNSDSRFLKNIWVRLLHEERELHSSDTNNFRTRISDSLHSFTAFYASAFFSCTFLRGHFLSEAAWPLLTILCLSSKASIPKELSLLHYLLHYSHSLVSWNNSTAFFLSFIGKTSKALIISFTRLRCTSTRAGVFILRQTDPFVA